MPAAIFSFSRGVTEACRSAKAADRVRVPAGKPDFHSSQGLEEKQQTRHPVKVETAGAAPVGTAKFHLDSLEALTVMQRSFKPRKQGRYLPGEPNMLVMVYQSAFHPVKVTEPVRIRLANPNFFSIPRLRGRTARQTAATRPMWVQIPPESPFTSYCYSSSSSYSLHLIGNRTKKRNGNRREARVAQQQRQQRQQRQQT